MNLGQLILVAVSLFGYGFCSACKDATLWQGENVIFEVWWGGNSKWIWTSDSWHRFKHLEQTFLYLAVFFALGLEWYWLPVVFLLSSVIVGRSFVLFYHTLLLKEPDQSFADWLKGTFLLWSKHK